VPGLQAAETSRKPTTLSSSVKDREAFAPEVQRHTPPEVGAGLLKATATGAAAFDHLLVLTHRKGRAEGAQPDLRA
jgi:hypothetical protein